MNPKPLQPTPTNPKIHQPIPSTSRGIESEEGLRWRGEWGRTCWDNLNRRYWRNRKYATGEDATNTLFL